MSQIPVRFLRALSSEAARIVPCATGYRILGPQLPGNGVMIRAETLRLCVSEGLLEPCGDDQTRFLVTPACHAAAARSQSPTTQAFQAQHRADAASGRARVRGAASSFARWGAAGREPFLEAREVAAGEALLRDMELSAFQPHTTMHWNGAGTSSGKRTYRDRSDALSARALDARSRVDAALKTVGRPMDDVLWRVCFEDVQVERVERELRWPRRSGKVAMKLALARLADHYRIGV